MYEYEVFYNCPFNDRYPKSKILMFRNPVSIGDTVTYMDDQYDEDIAILVGDISHSHEGGSFIIQKGFFRH